jgi:hypothetical protein
MPRADAVACAAVGLVDLHVDASGRVTALSETARARARAVGANLTFVALETAAPAVGAARAGVGALRGAAASLRVGGAATLTRAAGGTPGAHDPTRTAIVVVGIRVDASTRAVCLTRSALAHTSGLRADFARSAGVAASATVGRVRGQVDASTVAQREAARASADARITDLTTRASVAASAAVLRVRRDVQTGATAQLLLGGAAAVRARSVDASLARRANGAARPAVAKARVGVDALTAARGLPNRTDALPARADFATGAERRAITAVIDVAHHVDASATTSFEPVAASLGANTGATNFTGVARGRAVTTMRGVVADIDATIRTCRQPRIARAAGATGADLGHGTGGVTVTAMGSIAGSADATVATQTQPRRAASSACA